MNDDKLIKLAIRGFWITSILGIILAFLLFSAFLANRYTEAKIFSGVQIMEDGSGVQYVESQEVRTFPEGTFAWDCFTMGNKKCANHNGLTLSENIAELRELQR